MDTVDIEERQARFIVLIAEILNALQQVTRIRIGSNHKKNSPKSKKTVVFPTKIINISRCPCHNTKERKNPFCSLESFAICHSHQEDGTIFSLPIEGMG